MLEIRYNARQEQYEFRVFREPPTAATQASIPFAPLTENTAVPGNLSPVSRRTFTEVQGILRGQAGSFLPTLDRNQEMFTFLSLLGQEEGYSGREGNGAWRRSWNFPGSNLSISFNGDTGRFQYSMEQTPLHRRQWTDITRNSPLPHLGVDSQFDRSLRADAQLRRDNYTFERVRDALTAARTPESNALCAQLARSTELLNGVFRPASANAQFANLYSCPIGYQSSVSGGTTVFLSPVLEAGQITWFYSISNGSNRVPGWGSFRPISEFNPEQFGEVAQNQTAIQASLALNGLRNSQTQSAQYAIRAIRDGLQILSGVPVGISRPFRENWSGFDSTHVRLTTRGIAGAPQSDRHTEFRFNSENSRWQWREPQGDWITIGESDRPWYSEAEGSDPANVLLNSLGRRLQLLR